MENSANRALSLSLSLSLSRVIFIAPLHGFAFWFDVEFNGPVRQKSKKQPSQSSDGNAQNASPSSKKKKPDVSIVLSTAPEDAPTHWQQVIVFHSNILISFT
jgi:protein arginine N-methyltransferase 6